MSAASDLIERMEEETGMNLSDEKRFEVGPGVNLSGKNLRWADLTGADLYRADLREANLTGAFGLPTGMGRS